MRLLERLPMLASDREMWRTPTLGSRPVLRPKEFTFAPRTFSMYWRNHSLALVNIFELKEGRKPLQV
jgi:hypothetical protein